MSLILHHYDFSNFAEKARLMLGFKGLAWRGVEIPPSARSLCTFRGWVTIGGAQDKGPSLRSG